MTSVTFGNCYTNTQILGNYSATDQAWQANLDNNGNTISLANGASMSVGVSSFGANALIDSSNNLVSAPFIYSGDILPMTGATVWFQDALAVASDTGCGMPAISLVTVNVVNNTSSDVTITIVEAGQPQNTGVPVQANSSLTVAVNTGSALGVAGANVVGTDTVTINGSGALCVASDGTLQFIASLNLTVCNCTTDTLEFFNNEIDSGTSINADSQTTVTANVGDVLSFCSADGSFTSESYTVVSSSSDLFIRTDETISTSSCSGSSGGEDGGSGPRFWWLIFIVIGIFVFILIVVLIARHHRNQRQEEAQEELIRDQRLRVLEYEQQKRANQSRDVILAIPTR